MSARCTGYVPIEKEVNMIAGVRTRTIMAMPRRAWRVIKATAPRVKAAREREPRPGLIESFERMLSSQVQLMLKDLES
jgi:hypothetical protein